MGEGRPKNKKTSKNRDLAETGLKDLSIQMYIQD